MIWEGLHAGICGGGGARGEGGDGGDGMDAAAVSRGYFPPHEDERSRTRRGGRKDLEGIKGTGNARGGEPT